jgi:hypothetical protein
MRNKTPEPIESAYRIAQYGTTTKHFMRKRTCAKASPKRMRRSQLNTIWQTQILNAHAHAKHYSESNRHWNRSTFKPRIDERTEAVEFDSL